MFLLNYTYTCSTSFWPKQKQTNKPHVKEQEKKSKRREKENFDENHFNSHPSPNPKPLKKFLSINRAQENKVETC